MRTSRFFLRQASHALLVTAMMYSIGLVLISASPIRRDAELNVLPFSGWGTSWETGQAVSDRLLTATVPSTLIFILGTFISFLIGMPLGVASGLSRRFNYWSSGILTVLSAIPALVTGFVAIRLFAVEFPIFPLSGFESLTGAIARRTAGVVPAIIVYADVLYHSLLPAFIIAVADGNLKDVIAGASAAVQTHRRMGYLEALQFVGISRSRIVARYFARSATVSALTALRLRIPLLFGGLIIVEQLFVIPGLGGLFVRAVEYNDVPVLRALVVVLSLATGFAFLGSALVTVLVDPTIRADAPEGKIVVS